MNLYFHIGARRAASTYLQNKIFPFSRYNYIGKTEKDYPDVLIDLFYLDDLEWEKNKDHIKNKFDKKLRYDVENIVSTEAITNVGTTFRNLKRIASIYPTSKIIYVNRDVKELLLSNYYFDIFTEKSLRSILSFDDTTRPLVVGKRNTENIYELNKKYIKEACQILNLELHLVDFRWLINAVKNKGNINIADLKFTVSDASPSNQSMDFDKVKAAYIENFELNYGCCLSFEQKQSIYDRLDKEMLEFEKLIIGNDLKC